MAPGAWETHAKNVGWVVVAIVVSLPIRVIRQANSVDLIGQIIAMGCSLFVNMILCATQVVTIVNLFDYSKDHINHFDVEKSISRLLFPEQMLQVILMMLHLWNGAWSHALLQTPLAIWHVACILSGRPPIQAVLGEGRKFDEQVQKMKTFSMFKAVLYGFTMVYGILALCPLLIEAIMGSNAFKAVLHALHTNYIPK